MNRELVLVSRGVTLGRQRGTGAKRKLDAQHRNRTGLRMICTFGGKPKGAMLTTVG